MVLAHYLKPYVAWVTGWWRNNHRASSVWRLTRLYTGLLMLVVGILLWVLYQLSVGQLGRSQSQQLSQLVQQQQLLAEELNQQDFISQFTLQAKQSKQFVLAYSDGNTTYGRLASIPKRAKTCPRLARFPVYNYNEIRLFSGCVQSLSNGQLLVATDDEALFDLRELFLQASMVALALALGLGLMTGWFFSAQVLRRVNSFNHIAQQVEAGELSARVPIGPRNDEFDHMAKHINKMLAQVEHSFQAIAGVTDAVAHDLRTPLSRLRLRIEQALLDVEHQDIGAKQLAQMLAELDQILSTFTAMLELTRLEQHQQKSSFKAVDLATVAEDAIELIQPLCQDRQQNLQLTILQPCTISGDATLLFRAIYNLLENASKYAGEQSDIELMINGDGFALNDTGPGIPEEETDKVFQRLYRLESSRNSPGYGLGLPLVRAIIRLHGGEIKLENNRPGLRVAVTF
ncbi:HAMP domain-containing histidine kinase [Agarivorans sp. TSD2052]|uniref:sensor histidine kinase n=1 Tax=Agarivorans sp. TSD2052 TaxID=2937286 RepID=UPI00200BAC07|nr:HAMP domain-containing sensor histidine kinase [Agarivorans sp. TSD2052]UPW18791.1 HAMP domain-containing histidine kinase [Agarivorans sp. TSD2052]